MLCPSPPLNFDNNYKYITIKKQRHICLVTIVDSHVFIASDSDTILCHRHSKPFKIYVLLEKNSIHFF